MTYCKGYRRYRDSLIETYNVDPDNDDQLIPLFDSNEASRDLILKFKMHWWAVSSNEEFDQLKNLLMGDDTIKHILTNYKGFTVSYVDDFDNEINLMVYYNQPIYVKQAKNLVNWINNNILRGYQ